MGGQRRRGISGVAAFVLALLCFGSDAAQSSPLPVAERVAELGRVAPGIDLWVLNLALEASTCAAGYGLVTSSDILTVIDYSRPSNEPRLWVLDVARRRLLYRELVAHGRESGELYAARFSNDLGSQQSSLGLFVTAELYDGQHGRSLRLHGLETGINDHAFERMLVMHGAGYVSPEFAVEQGRLGRSHGCPAVPLAVADALLDTIHGGTPVFAYYTDSTWLETSRFLGPCVEEAAASVPTPGPPASAAARPDR